MKLFNQVQPTAKSHLLAVLLTALLAVGIAACGGSTEPAASPETPAETAQPATPTAPIEAEPAAPAEGSVPEAAAPETAARNGMYSAPPEMAIDPDRYYYATFQTEKGEIVVQLFPDRAPMAVNNFVFLAREGFYDNTTFHRVLDDFMAQGGDPTGTGSGGPGYAFPDEFVQGLEFDRPGLLAMANSGPNTNGSQFFITFSPVEWLNYLHTIFGEVIEGQEVLDELTRRDPMQNPEFLGDELQSVQIEERDSSALPTPTPPPPTPTPFAPTDLGAEGRPLAEVPVAERTAYFNSPPSLQIDPARHYTATVQTSQGDLVVLLYAAEAPAAVNNFVVLANLGFYDGLPINEVAAEQFVVLGAPANEPASDVGYSFQAELSTEIALNEGVIGFLPHQDPFTGVVDANGSQLFVALSPLPSQAAGQVAAFGQVVEGMDVLTALTGADTIETITVAEE